jgi:flagellar P-ring protein precursor FlgI
MTDAGTVALDVVAANMRSPAHVLGRVENLLIAPESRARVVVDQRSGTIVMGTDVRISEVAVAQGNLTLSVQEAPQVVQPNPFAQGRTVVVPDTTIDVTQEKGTGLAMVTGGTNLSQVVAGLNALGVAPNDMIDILKSINSAGALHAEFIVQ